MPMNRQPSTAIHQPAPHHGIDRVAPIAGTRGSDSDASQCQGSVVEVRGQSLQVPSAFLQVRESPPRQWTIVPRPSDAVRLPASWGDRYAVCPSCRERQPIAGRPRRMACTRCRGEFDVAWTER